MWIFKSRVKESIQTVRDGRVSENKGRYTRDRVLEKCVGAEMKSIQFAKGNNRKRFGYCYLSLGFNVEVPSVCCDYH